jgi:hypothetical protein
MLSLPAAFSSYRFSRRVQKADGQSTYAHIARPLTIGVKKAGMRLSFDISQSQIFAFLAVMPRAVRVYLFSLFDAPVFHLLASIFRLAILALAAPKFRCIQTFFSPC